MGVLGERRGEKTGKEGAEGSGWARLGGMRQILSSPLGEGTIRNRRREDPAVFVHYLPLPPRAPGSLPPCLLISSQHQPGVQTFPDKTPSLASHSAFATRGWAGALARQAEGRPGDEHALEGGARR